MRDRSYFHLPFGNECAKRNNATQHANSLRFGRHPSLHPLTAMTRLNDSVRVGLQDLPFGVFNENAYDNNTRITTTISSYLK